MFEEIHFIGKEVIWYGFKLRVLKHFLVKEAVRRVRTNNYY